MKLQQIKYFKRCARCTHDTLTWTWNNVEGGIVTTGIKKWNKPPPTRWNGSFQKTKLLILDLFINIIALGEGENPNGSLEFSIWSISHSPLMLKLLHTCRPSFISVLVFSPFFVRISRITDKLNILNYFCHFASAAWFPHLFKNVMLWEFEVAYTVNRC